MKCPRIAIIVCAWPPSGGGIGNNAYYHAKLLHERGYDVMACTPRYRNSRMQPEPWLKPLKASLAHGLAACMFGLWRELKRYDIIHLYYPFFGTDLIVWLWAVLHPQSKLVLHYQMDPVGTGWKRWLFTLHMRICFPWLVWRTDQIIALSEDHARHSYLAPYFQRWPHKFATIPNGVDTDMFAPAPRDAELERRCGIMPSDRVILFVGGLDRQHYFKGVEVLLEATSRLQEQYGPLKLLIIGNGDLRPQYEHQAQTLGIAAMTIFAGWVDNDRLPAYYNLADIFVLPSTARTESFGIVIAEAQACGVPALVSDWPGSRQTIEAGETGLLLEPGSADDLYQKLSQLLGDDSLRQRLSRGAQARAAARYNWRQVIDSIIAVYEKL